MNLPAKEDRFVGALLGTACGDALGVPFEGVASPGEVREFLPSRFGTARYTDDTQMTLALTESLIRNRGGVDGADCARAYVERYEPHRGYGHGAHVVMELLRRGEDYRNTGTSVFPDGSFGNGSAMRIAPIGLLYGAGEATGLRDAVFEAVRCTHVHPEAVDAAVMQARLVGILSSESADTELRFADLADDLRSRAKTAVLASRIGQIADLLAAGADGERAVRELGNGIRASEAVPAATWAAFRYDLHPEESIVRAVGLGGDTDTIGAMTGALVGARRGASQLPRRWVESLENGPYGRDEIVRLGRELASISKGKDEP